MLNIFRIFISDFKRIKTNVVAVVIVIGLSILPCLYAWFNILSNWSPYGPDATSNIKVAVASDDKGITIDDTEFNMGETVIEGLEANTTIGWVFTDTTEEAIDGVYSGDYYAALIMPEDFTEDMVSFLADEMEHPEIKEKCDRSKDYRQSKNCSSADGQYTVYLYADQKLHASFRWTLRFFGSGRRNRIFQCH